MDEIRALPESDLQAYMQYAAEHLLPSHRRDFYQAQTAYYIAATMGGYKGKISDFMLGANQTADNEPMIDWDGEW